MFKNHGKFLAMKNSALPVRIAAAVMVLGIALGAMGAHALKERLGQTGHLEEWKTAALYQMIHGLALFVAALRTGRFGFCGWAWLAGVILFSGSLYLLSYSGSKALPIVLATPAGGLAFLLGWASLLLFPGQLRSRESD